MASQNHIDYTRPKYQLELLQILKSNQKLLKVRIPFLYDIICKIKKFILIMIMN